MEAFTGMTAGQQALLSEAGRSGLFVFDDDDLSAKVTTDTQQAIYVAPASDDTGASGAWVRRVDGAPYQAGWWGVVADDGTINNDTALAAAIAFLPTAVPAFDGYREGMAELLLPPGVVRVTTSGILSNLGSGVIGRSGYKLRGHGPRSTILWMDGSGGGTKWFYDNGATRRMTFAVFEDVGFYGGSDWHMGNPATDVGLPFSNLDTDVNGFKFTGPGSEDAHVFTRCDFGWLQQVAQWEGTNNADTNRFDHCNYWKCNNVFHINNLQSLSISDAAGYALIYGNYLTYGASAVGGGNFRKSAGAIVMLADEAGVDAYALKIDQAGPGANCAPVIFDGVRFELRGTRAKLALLTTFYANSQTQFTGCSLLNTSTANKEIVELGGYQTLQFDKCSFMNQSTGRMQFKITSNARYMHNPHLIFRASQIPATIHDDVIWNGGSGKLSIDTLCSSGEIAAPTAPIICKAIACNRFGTSKLNSTSNRSNQRFTASPVFADGILHNAEYVVELPPYAEIVEVWAKFEPNGAPASTYQIHIGNDDKSLTYATSPAQAFNLGGSVYTAGIFKNVASSSTDRNVRFWFSNGAGGAASSSVNASAIPLRAGVVYE